MTTITKEQLIERIGTQKETAFKYPECSIARIDLRLAEIALAALTAEPIGYMNRFTGRVFSPDEQPGADTDTAVYLPVYTAPPVPDELLSAMEEVLRISDRDHEAWHKARNGITSCRAAMLQSFGNSEQLEPVTEAYKLRERVRREHAEWSDKTFGDVGPVGPLKHLSKEALEAAANPEDPLEWADMQFLLWDAQRRMGISDRFITRAMIEKLAINKTRQWPEPKDGDPRLHIKEQPVPVVPDEIEPDNNNTYEYVDGWNACRASMLQGKYRDLSQPVDPQISEYEKIMLRAGWVMVPVEPTDEMIAAALDSHLIVFNPVKTYSVMLAAAPQPETSDGK